MRSGAILDGRAGPASDTGRVAAEQQELVTLLDALQALARGDAGPRYRAAARLRGRRRCGGGSARRTPPRGAVELSSPDERQPVNGWPDGLRLVVDNLLERDPARRVHGSHRTAPDERRRSPVLSVEDDGQEFQRRPRAHIRALSARIPCGRTRLEAAGWPWSPSRCRCTAARWKSATRRWVAPCSKRACPLRTIDAIQVVVI